MHLWTGKAGEQVPLLYRIARGEFGDREWVRVARNKHIQAKVGDVVAPVAARPARLAQNDMRGEVKLLELSEVAPDGLFVFPHHPCQFPGREQWQPDQPAQELQIR